MPIGYARVSTTEQNIESQIDALRKAGCENFSADLGVARKFRLGQTSDPLASVQQSYRTLQREAPPDPRGRHVCVPSPGPGPWQPPRLRSVPGPWALAAAMERHEGWLESNRQVNIDFLAELKNEQLAEAA